MSNLIDLNINTETYKKCLNSIKCINSINTNKLNDGYEMKSNIQEQAI